MQNYYEQHQFGSDPTHLSLQLSFAQTIYNILINVLGPLSQLILSTLGPRNTLLVSVVISSLGLLLASFSTEVTGATRSSDDSLAYYLKVWHLYLTHGVVYGTGVSIMFYVGKQQQEHKPVVMTSTDDSPFDIDCAQYRSSIFFKASRHRPRSDIKRHKYRRARLSVRHGSFEFKIWSKLVKR
jgi:hypothetical protein